DWHSRLFYQCDSQDVSGLYVTIAERASAARQWERNPELRLQLCPDGGPQKAFATVPGRHKQQQQQPYQQQQQL
ncbi:hypothetical protein AWZ03_009854, partial [Drosophila navojoa]